MKGPSLQRPLAVLLLMMASAVGAMPIGLYGIAETADIPIARRAGFNWIQTDAHDGAPGLIAAARAEGLRALTYDFGVSGAPGILPDGWYVADEPEVSGLSPKSACEKAAALAARGSGVPRILVVGTGKAAAAYSACCDVMMVDWYPVPHMPLSTLETELDAAASGMPSGKPLWAVIQAFDWKDYPQRRHDRVGRFPYASEMRTLAYAALIHGARGLFFYTYRDPRGKPLSLDAGRWFSVSEVAAELADFGKVIDSGEPAALPFVPDPDGVEARAWRHQSRLVVLLVNATDRPLKTPTEIRAPRWRAVYEARANPADALQSSEGRFYLPPGRALVVEQAAGLGGAP